MEPVKTTKTITVKDITVVFKSVERRYFYHTNTILLLATAVYCIGTIQGR